MRRFILLGVAVAALCGVLGVTAGGASAVDLGKECGKVATPKTGRYKDNKCSEVDPNMEGEFLVVEAKAKGFKISSGESVLTAGGLILFCKKDKGTGKIINDIEIEVTIEFQECKVRNPKGEECEIPNIATNPLLGQAGTIATTEATSKMGVFFKPKTGSVWMKHAESVKCNTPATSVEGTLVCEGAEQIKSVTGKVACLVEGGKQKAKKIGILESGAKGKEVTKEGNLKEFGVAATLSTVETITFEEALTLFP
jgi:hypothetical protein